MTGSTDAPCSCARSRAGRAQARQITRWLLLRPEHLQPVEQASLNAIRASCPHIDALAGHVPGFAKIMTARTGDRSLEATGSEVQEVTMPAANAAGAPRLSVSP